ncbi:MAG: aspartate aminotransferase family protein [Gammaproteobacteria bacterium]
MHNLERDTAVPPLLATYAPYPFEVESGARDCIVDRAGHRWLDFYGGHCVASTGHCHPAVAAAITTQAHRLIFYSAAADLPVRREAAAALVQFAANDMATVFFCNSGAEANENALKLATKLTGRSKFVAFRGAFHGRTLLALSVTDSAKLHQGYESLLAAVMFLPFADNAALAAADFSDAAGVIVEPIQSMAGIKTAATSWFTALREKCMQSGTLLIFDEVQTGIGRLGAPFAANLYSITPDFITCAKGMASGVPMGGLLMRAEIAAELKPGDLGSTFGGGPLACAALLATLKVILDEQLMQHATNCAQRIRAAAGGVVREVRGEGLLLGLDCGLAAKAVKAHLFNSHILVGGSDDPQVLRLMPPLDVSDAAVDTLLDALSAFPAEAAA